MLFPAITGSGLSALVIDRSALVPTAMLDVALLFPGLGSAVAEPTVAVSVIRVPIGVFAFTFSVTTKVPLTPLLSVAILQLMFPAAPTAGFTHTHPGGVGSDTNVVFGGVASENVAVA